MSNISDSCDELLKEFETLCKDIPKDRKYYINQDGVIYDGNDNTIGWVDIEKIDECNARIQERLKVLNEWLEDLELDIKKIDGEISYLNGINKQTVIIKQSMSIYNLWRTSLVIKLNRISSSIEKLEKC